MRGGYARPQSTAVVAPDAAEQDQRVVADRVEQVVAGPETTGSTSTNTTEHEIVNHGEWLEACTALLGKEKEFTRLRDELSRERRELPSARCGRGVRAGRLLRECSSSL